MLLAECQEGRLACKNPSVLMGGVQAVVSYPTPTCLLVQPDGEEKEGATGLLRFTWKMAVKTVCVVECY